MFIHGIPCMQHISPPDLESDKLERAHLVQTIQSLVSPAGLLDET